MAIRVATLDKLSRGSTIKIASSEAHEKSKQVADYVCDGENDLDIFTQAIAELVSVGGGTLELSEGAFYLISDELTELEIWDDILIKGQGVATFLRFIDNVEMWVQDGSTGFKDLQIGASSNYAITYRGGGHHFLDNVQIGSMYGIDYFNEYSNDILLINGCTFSCGDKCVYTDEGHISISNSTLRSANSPTTTAVYTEYNGSVSMDNCIADNVLLDSIKTHRIVNSKLDEVYAGDDVDHLIFVGNECYKLDAPGGVVRPTSESEIIDLNHITIITLREE